MQVTETLSSGLKREYKVVVNAAELGKELDSKLHEMAGRANIKGFRPGKVPVPHLKRMYGKALMAEVVQKTIDDQSKQVLAERNLKPAYQPEVKLPEEEKEVNAIMAGEGDFAFSLAFEIIPTFELKDVSGVELTRHVVEITDAQVDEALGRLTAQYKAWEPKSGKAAKGDKVTIGFVGKVDGKVFDGGTAEDVPLELGSGQFIPGFEDQLIGAKAGDELVVKVTFPATYGVKELAGKPAEFAVKVAGVEGPKEGTVDDEFAKKMGFEDLGKLKDMIRARLSQEYASMTGMKLKRDVLDALDGLYSFELPQRLVEAEFDGIWKALVRGNAEGRQKLCRRRHHRRSRQEGIPRHRRTPGSSWPGGHHWFVGKVDGKVFDGGTAEDVPLELGSGQFIPGFEDQLIGTKAGDELVVKVTFPATYGVKELAGKPAEFAVKVAGVEAPKEGTVDDEFAKKMGFEDLGKAEGYDPRAPVPGICLHDRDEAQARRSRCPRWPL